MMSLQLWSTWGESSEKDGGAFDFLQTVGLVGDLGKEEVGAKVMEDPLQTLVHGVSEPR